MLSNSILDRFIENSPLSVLSRGMIERILSPEELDEWFERTVDAQYTRDLLFSTVFDIMAGVVGGMHSSVHSAYKASQTKVGVSITAVYNKLNGMEVNTSAELVRYAANSVIPIIKKLGGMSASPLPGYHVKLIDGNCIEASEHRIKELRDNTAGPLPGKSLVIYDPVLRMPVDVFPCEDGHAQERSLFNSFLKTVSSGELWVADRNFCTRNFLFSIDNSRAHFVIRQHGALPFCEIGPERTIGEADTGTVFEQPIATTNDSDNDLKLRRIRVHLNNKTRDGDKDIFIVTNLPLIDADAITIANIYRGRWKIETSFQELAEYYNSEINTLGYPRAALFGFCVALVSYIILAVIKAALSCVHGSEKIENEVSPYYIANELTQTYPGMMIALPIQEWRFFRVFSNDELIKYIKMLVRKVDLSAYKKHKRGPKKPKEKIKHCSKNSHVSTAKLIAKRKR